MNKQDKSLKGINNFSGTIQYHNLMGVNITDGCKYLADNGYTWFLTDFLVVAKMKPELKRESFLTIDLKLKGNKAQMIVTDGNDNVLYTQRYDYTDAESGFKLFYTDNVLMLAGEY